jgi:opacity protein-like surface antigen
VIALILPIAVMTPLIDGARAEGFVDFRGGGAATQGTDATAKIGPARGEPQAVFLSGTIEFEDGVTIGIRGGYWLAPVPWLGFAFDLSYFDADEDASEPVKFDVFPISGLLMLRYPLLTGSNYPRGRLQPYVGVGPGAFVTTAKIELKKLAGAPENFNDTNVDVGLDARAGVNFNVVKFFAVFGEYRFTHFKPSDFKEDIADVPIELETDQWNTHHFVVGVGLHF